ncbi:MAG: DUF721 domain-containing protein [Pseudomonadota bacterium]
MNKRQKGFSTISEILKDSTNRLGIGNNLYRYKLWDLWADIVGAEIAANARPARWYGNTLVVRAQHPAWIQELGFLKSQMIEKIQSVVPKARLKDIRYEVGSLPPMPKIADKTEATICCELDTDEKEFIDCASNEISDPDIREAAKKAMCKSFALMKNHRTRHK